jgi:hypothetical protein
MALLDEVAQWEGILVRVSRCKTLVCHIEESIVTAALHSLTDLLPLLRCRVDTSRIVRASMKQESASLRGSLNIRNHALEVQANSVLIIVSVLLNLEAGVLEDRSVVCP